MKIIERIKNINIKPKNEPLKPMARRRSKKKIQMYIKPTSFVTNIPEIREKKLRIRFSYSQLNDAFQKSKVRNEKIK